MKFSLALLLLLPALASAKKVKSTAATVTIDFEGFMAGDFVQKITSDKGATGDFTGHIDVFGRVPGKFKDTNTAMIFDSSCPDGVCSGGDYDLETEIHGNILINSEDLNQDNPDDVDFTNPDPANDGPGSFLEFEFTNVEEELTLHSITYIDLEKEQGEDGVFVEIWGGDDDLEMPPKDMIAIPPTGDGKLGKIKNIKVSGVKKLRWNQNGSGGLVEIAMTAAEEGLCWSTTGGFQNAGIKSGSKDFTFGGNVGPPSSGMWEVVDHVTGNNFHSNDVEVVSCGVVDDLSGPQQPGGKKGFDINLLNFQGSGRLRNAENKDLMTGLFFTGCVMDAGEPAGKKGNDKDYFEIVVCVEGESSCEGSGLCEGVKPPTAADDIQCPKVEGNVAFAACGNLDGGNVQLHPPVGKPARALRG